MGVVMGISTLWIDCVQVTVTVSYAIHCHLVSNYMSLLHSRVTQHSISLSDCIKESDGYFYYQGFYDGSHFAM